VDAVASLTIREWRLAERSICGGGGSIAFGREQFAFRAGNRCSGDGIRPSGAWFAVVDDRRRPMFRQAFGGPL